MKKISMLLLLQLLVYALCAQTNLNGIVKGNGAPLPGASVIIKNTFYGVSTDANGFFEFKNLKQKEITLKVSFIGFETKEFVVNVLANKNIQIELLPDVIFTEEVMISATRAGEKTPMSYTNVSGQEIAQKNMGQDIPYLLQISPSFVATSDAGAGIGYTNFRIRGTDLNRINVSVNGIPLNDAESHGTWFVDLPDLASSLENVQIQRGVGTSTNGAAAFGATINLQTNNINKNSYGNYKTAFGSFNTFKNTLAAGTGLINGKFTVDARLSKVTSNGFIDRASSDLKSFFVSAGYFTENTVIKANVFSGFEETYQAWWGVPSVRLNNDLEGMKRYEEHWLYTPKQTLEMINSDSRTYNYYTYENQVDHYQQDHYQVHFSHKFNSNLIFNTSLHYTYGRGYYENYEEDENLTDYQLPEIVVGQETIESTDLVNRKWLDNDFYGITYSLKHKKNSNTFTLGGAYNIYNGNHFGKIIWAQFYGKNNINHNWYKNSGLKKDINIFAKYSLQLNSKINLFADMQFRTINYKIAGIDDDLRNITQSHNFNFFNPKLGIFYQLAPNQDIFISYAVANRKQKRAAFVDYPQGYDSPVHETLSDIELGYNYSSSNISFSANYYYMHYKNQLVVTGQINDVGAPIMVNANKSYRTGIELQAGIKLTKNTVWNLNATISSNKIKDFVEYVDNWDTWEQEIFELGTTDLAFSPALIANSQLKFSPLGNLNIGFTSSYVGKQFIDNTSNNERTLNSYFINNLKFDYALKTNLFEEITLHALINNLFNEKYESNAWVYSYILGGERFKMDGYFPQAGIQFMLGVDFNF